MFGLSRPARPSPTARRSPAPLSRRQRWARRLVRRSAAVLVLLVAIALTAARAAPDDVVTVVAADRTLPAGHVVTAGDLTTRSVPVPLAATAVTSTAAAIGRRLAGPVDAGELLTRSRFVPASPDHLPGGTAPIHLIAADPAAVDLLAPGGVVDVYVPASGDPGGLGVSGGPGACGGPGARGWQAVTGSDGAVVLTVDPATTTSTYGPTATPRGAVVALTPEQMRRVLGAAEPGQPLVAHLLTHPG